MSSYSELMEGLTTETDFQLSSQVLNVLNIALLGVCFKAVTSTERHGKISYELYRRVFESENISFTAPSTD